jgi:hypothetical protein
MIDYRSVGFYKQFPSLATYLKNVRVEFDGNKLIRIERYPLEPGFKFRYAPQFECEAYSAYDLYSDLGAYSAWLRCEAIFESLSSGCGWSVQWPQAVEATYWHDKLHLQVQRKIRMDFDAGRRRQFLPTLDLHRTVPTMALCILFGWRDMALDLAERLCSAIDEHGVSDAGDDFHRRAHYFMLRLVREANSFPARDWPACAKDEPLFELLLQHWRMGDFNELVPLLIGACDRHTHEARPDSSKQYYDFPRQDATYLPLEALLVLRLRADAGLEIPAPEALIPGLTDHPLMKTPLGKLPQTCPPSQTPLIQNAVAVARAEFPLL